MLSGIIGKLGNTIIENIIAVVLVFILVGLFGAGMRVYIREARENALNNQLTNIKYSIELYKMLEGGYPENLKRLNAGLKAVKEDPLYGKRYLEHQALDSEGYPIDPFGNRFIYDYKTGKVERRNNDK